MEASCGNNKNAHKVENQEEDETKQSPVKKQKREITEEPNPTMALKHEINSISLKEETLNQKR